MYRDLNEMLEVELDKRGLTGRQFAKLLGVSPAAVSNIITGAATLSLTEWGRWFGALHLKMMFSPEPIGASMGFFINDEDVWAWLVKRLARSGKPAPLRSAGEFKALLELAGVLGWYRELLPMHLSPVIKSGWLWREGADTAEGLAAQVRELLAVADA